MGRNNDMVKINGNRVEPGEIEAVCKKVLHLSNCVAKGFEKEGVVALYYTDDREIDAATAKKKLSAHLPYYMIPSYYYQMDSLPQNSLGKVMRSELKLHIQKNQMYVPPRDEFEKKLADAFKSVLAVDEVGIKDDFFQMGGTSLSAIELLTLLEGENISAQLLYEMRTIENLSNYCQKGKQRKTYHSAEPDRVLYGLLRLVGFFVSHFVFHRKILRNEIKNVKTPFIVIANHEAALDFFNLIGLTGRRMIAVMSASYYYTMPFQRLLQKLNFIPKQQFQTEFLDIMKMKTAIDQGFPLVIYPAGIQTSNGISTHISEQTWEFLKLMGADVYVARTEGTYFVKPKWASAYRPGKTTMDVYRLFSKEMLQSQSVEEIGEKALAALEYDAYKEQEKHRWKYKKNTIEGLQNVLYICPQCKQEYTIHLCDPYTLECEHCGFTQTSDEFGMMHNTKEPEREIRLVSDWARVMQAELVKKIKAGFSLTETVVIHTLDKEHHCFRENGKGSICLNQDDLVLKGTLFDRPFELKLASNQLSGLPVQPGKFLEIQHNQDIYRCYLDDRRKTMQFVDLLSLLALQDNRANR